MVNKAELRQFITQYFSDLELDELCFDYYPDLLNQFTTGMTKSQKVIALIGYCDRRGLSGHLLVTLAKLRPAAYQDQFGLVPKPQTSAHVEGRNPNQIFLSHANQDAAFARELAGDLRRNGFEIWMAPESIEPGEKWVDAIERGLETSGIFVLVITPHAANSKWVRDESNYAIALQNKDEMRFFTLHVGEGRMPPMWSVRQHISFREDYDDGLRQLLAALRPDRFAVLLKPEPVAAVSKGAEPPTVTRAPLPAASRAGESATGVANGPIVAPDPVLSGPAVKTGGMKPMYWALGMAVLLVVMFLGWRLMAGDLDGGDDYVIVDDVTPATPSGEDGGVGMNLTRTPTRPSAQAGDIRAVSRGVVKVEQVFAPAGSFMMGSNNGSSDEQPVHEVTLDAFWIDRTEVTNAQFAACVADGACRSPSDRSSATHSSYYGNAQYADYPVINVSWNDARDFCEWAGGRLPTEAEWEYAARGPESFTYPWGNNQPTAALLNFNNNVGDTSEVDSYPDGVSWVGAFDMAGNVWEWVNDWYDDKYYSNSSGESPPGPASGEYRMLRGGAWISSFVVDYVRSANRNGSLPGNRDSSIGFRCAQE